MTWPEIGSLLVSPVVHRLACRVARRSGRICPESSHHRRSRAAAGPINDELNYASDARPCQLATATNLGQGSSAGLTRSLIPLFNPLDNLALSNAAEPSCIGIDHPTDKSGRGLAADSSEGTALVIWVRAPEARVAIESVGLPDGYHHAL